MYLRSTSHGDIKSILGDPTQNEPTQLKDHGLIMDLLGKRFATRNLLRNKRYHNYDGPIPAEDITEEKEPEIRGQIARFAKFLVDNPNELFADLTYTQDERVKDWNKLVDADTSKYESRSRTGHKLLDHHMPHFWNVKNHKGHSVRSQMTQEALEKALYHNLKMHTTPYRSEIRHMLILTGGLGSVTKYRAGVSKNIVDRYDAVSVLDPCIGWGGRMIGSLAAGASYTGCEPDPNTFQGLQGILSDCKQIAAIHNEPAETVVPTLPSGSFDMVLTSPPYYTLEIYTAGEQSVKNQSWDEWVSGWLKPLVIECLRCLKTNGKSCWSVKDFKMGRLYPLATVVADIHREQGWALHEVITLTGPGRPGATRASEEQTFVYGRVLDPQQRGSP